MSMLGVKFRVNNSYDTGLNKLLIYECLNKDWITSDDLGTIIELKDSEGGEGFIINKNWVDKGYVEIVEDSPVNVFSLIEQWAEDRNLIEGSDPKTQFLKLIEEVGELAEGLAKGNADLTKDGIGDVVVVLTILAKQLGTSLEECVSLAYDEIKDRKGKMVDGVFIKEGV